MKINYLKFIHRDIMNLLRYNPFTDFTDQELELLILKGIKTIPNFILQDASSISTLTSIDLRVSFFFALGELTVQN